MPTEVEQTLHRSLTVRLRVADDQPATIVLNCPGEDLAGAGAELVDHHDERAVPCGTLVHVLVRLALVVFVFHHHDRAGVDEQAGQVDRFGQRTAAVEPQVEHHGVDMLLAELRQDRLHIAGRALVVRQTQASSFHVHVEARQVDEADLIGLAVADLLDHFAPGFALFQFDLSAGDVVDHLLGLAVRNHFQADDRAALAADLFDRLVQAEVGRVFDRPVFALADADDPVLLLQLAVFERGPAGNDLVDDRVAVVVLQLRTDAVQLQPHRDLEVFLRRRRHVGRVRIVGRRHGRQIPFEQVVMLELMHPLLDAQVAARKLVAGFLAFHLLGGLQHQQVVLDLLPPQVFRLFRCLGVLGLLRVAGKLFVDREVKRLG